ncbi:MAG: hypothetical protein IKU95_00215 [Clostridia bacterium]|nr:hypothetical protein [Clostridia bacterium]
MKFCRKIKMQGMFILDLLPLDSGISVLFLVEQIPLIDKGANRFWCDFDTKINDDAFGEAVDGRDVPACITPGEGFSDRDFFARCASLTLERTIPCDSPGVFCCVHDISFGINKKRYPQFVDIAYGHNFTASPSCL